MKKIYKTPFIRKYGLNVKYNILDGTVTSTGGSSGSGYGGGGTGGGRVKDRGTYGDLWAEDEEEFVFIDEDLEE